ncbi:MAG: divalent-cation tolerance protein CutA [Gammaproteobacteria bacterium]
MIEGKSAACVNILPGLTSIYLWKGAIESESEFLLIAKTHSGHFRKVEAAILDNHPYELPEIIAVPVEQGHSAYLRWIDTCLSSNPF